MTTQRTSMVYQTKDWSIKSNEEDKFNARNGQIENHYNTKKRSYEMIKESTTRSRNENVSKIKEHCDISKHIHSIQRIKNDRNQYLDSRMNVNFDNYEKSNMNGVTSREEDNNSSQIFDRGYYGSIHDHRNRNRFGTQYGCYKFGITNPEAGLCQDNNEEKELIDSRNVKTFDSDERHNSLPRLASKKVLTSTSTLYSIQKAVVHSIRPFGIFVQMEGYQDHGLVHISEVSNHEICTREDSEEAKMKALSTIANEGKVVWIKVISVRSENGKTRIGCSMKHVDQEDGSDLDPNNIQLEQQSSQPAPSQVEHYKMKPESATVMEEDDAVAMVQSHRKGKAMMMPRELSSGQMLPPCGIPKHLLATGSVGRGRAMVQPAWMKHGIGIGGPVAAASLMVEEEKQRSDVTERSMPAMVEDGTAVIARLKEEKRRRKVERRRRKERRQGRSCRGERHKRRRNGEERHGHRKKRRF
ncbi:hypothetical protein KC19_7G066100 [Ceratodon purpureus]|uniref:S1 motif domain-containing protein n=1 Tax=Ceratodon purpureus TaxID=3225 RepID=A0A8T0H5E3_CERPU|nr:hypothetical protein KC19_7G066100 [Ceratodon purpureus]